MYNVSMIENEEYREAKDNGKSSELHVFGVLRGGFSYHGSFYYTSRGHFKATKA